MLGSWFTKNPSEKHKDDSARDLVSPNERVQDVNTPTHHRRREHHHWFLGHRHGDSPHGQEPPEPPKPSPEPPQDDYFIPRGFRTEHDAALASLGVSPSDQQNTPGDDSTSLSVERPSESTHVKPRRNTANSQDSRPLTTEPFYDPFSGQVLGSLSPRTSYLSTSELGDSTETAGPAQFDAAREALWTHLAHIRTLQAQIAETHVQLDGVDGIGGWPGEPQTSGVGVGISGVGARRVSSTVGGVRAARGSGEWGEDDDGDEEAQRRQERENELSALEGRFARRQQAVDQVMTKLGELSQELMAFHALEMPEHIFLNTGTGADDSTTSGLPRDGSPSIASALLHGGSGLPSSSRLSAPGPRFDSSPAMPKRVLTPDNPSSGPHPHSPLSGGQSFPKSSLLISEEPEGNGS